MTPPIETIRAAITAVRAAEARGGSPSYMEDRAIDALNDNASAWLAELCDRVEAAETDVVDARLSIAQLCDVRDDLRRSVKAAEAKLAEAERERDAYKRAKAENDDRFMRERDEARAARDAAIAERDARPNIMARHAKQVLWFVFGGIPERQLTENDMEAMDAMMRALKAHAKASGGERV